MARRAGQILMKYFRNDLNVEHKGTIDLVTDADKAAEEMIFRFLEKQHPGDAILGEEGGTRDEGAERSGGSLIRWTEPLISPTGSAHFCVLGGAQVSN